MPLISGILGDKEEGHHGRAEEVRHENEAHAVVELLEERLAGRNLRHDQEDEEVQQDARDDEGQLQEHEAQRPALLAQAAEHDCLERILRRDEREHRNVLRVRFIAHRPGNRGQQQEDHREEEDPHAAHHAEGAAVDHLVVRAGLVREAEERRLHAEGQQRQEQRRVGVQVGHDAVPAALHGDVVRVHRHQQIVQEPPDDAHQPVQGCILR